MSAHLGYEKHDPLGRDGSLVTVKRAKTVLTEIGPVEIEVPRDTDASFQPHIVKKRQRRMTVRRDRVVVDRARVDDWGDLGALRRGLRRLVPG